MVERLTTVAIFCVFLSLLLGCREVQQTNYHIAYGIVGGKPSAPRELLTIDCRTHTIQFTRQQPFNDAQSTSQIQSLSIQHCQEIEKRVNKAQLCEALVSNKSHNKLEDGNTYTVT